MTVAFVAAAFLVFAPPSSPPPPSPAPSSPATAREVVFSFTYDETQEVTTNEIGQPPDTERVLNGYSGSLTVDFLGAAPTQNPNETQTPESAIELFLLLPYLAPDWFGSHPLDAGSSWQNDQFGDFQNIGVKYTVSTVAKSVVTIDAASKPASIPTSPRSGALSLEERFVYDTDSRLPTSLDAYAYLLQNGVEGIDAHAHYHFKLASDSAAQVSKP